MWRRLGVVVMAVALLAMGGGIWVATGSAGSVMVDEDEETCGPVVIEWIWFTDRGPEAAACGRLANETMNRALALFLGGALALTVVVGVGLVTVGQPDDE